MATQRAHRFGFRARENKMKLIVTMLTMLLLVGCSIIPKFSKQATEPAREAVDISGASKLTPKVFLIPEVLPDGTKVTGVAVGVEAEKSASALMESKGAVVRYTLWQRILRWMMGWSTIVAIMFVALTFISPTLATTILAFIKRRWKKVALETVRGLEKAGVKNVPMVAKELETAQSDKTKSRIKTLRVDGKI